MDWKKQLLLWEEGAISVVDIGYQMLWEGQDILSYRAPAHLYLLVVSGSAYIRAAERRCYVKAHHVLHIGQGTCIDIMPAKQEVSYYLLAYDVALPEREVDHGERVALWSEALEVWHHAVLSEPGIVHGQVRRMREAWGQGERDMISRLRMKAMMYEFAALLFSQLQTVSQQVDASDLVAHALQYMHAHYSEPLSMDKLADILGCSTSYMYRLFKSELGTSPNEYLIGVRMEQAQRDLATTSYPLRQIAQSVGYVDVYYFSRLFKRQCGVSPLQYRKRQLEAGGLQLNPSISSVSSIVPSASLSYNQCVNENESQIEREIRLLLKERPTTFTTAMLILCLSLLLSACQSAATPSPGTDQATKGNNAANNSSGAGNNPESQSEVETRMYKHKYGETEIPVHPKRVVTAYHLGHMLALDVRPLGAATYILQYSEPFMDTNGIVDLGAPLSLEQIADLEPDLIVLIDAYLEPSGGYDNFNKIAPTVVVEVAQDPVKDIRIIGDLLSKREEAEAWIAKYEEKIAETKEQVQSVYGPEETFTILNVRSEKIRMIYRDRNMGGNILYTYWGLKPQEKVLSDVINGIDDESSYLDISEEAIPDFVGDHLILASDEEGTEAVDKLLESKLWANLEAVKNNQVYRINFDEFLFNDPISAMKQVETLADVLTNR